MTHIRKILAFYKSLAKPVLIFSAGYVAGCFVTGMMVGLGGLQ